MKYFKCIDNVVSKRYQDEIEYIFDKMPKTGGKWVVWLALETSTLDPYRAHL